MAYICFRSWSFSSWIRSWTCWNSWLFSNPIYIIVTACIVANSTNITIMNSSLSYPSIRWINSVIWRIWFLWRSRCITSLCRRLLCPKCSNRTYIIKSQFSSTPSWIPIWRIAYSTIRRSIILSIGARMFGWILIRVRLKTVLSIRRDIGTFVASSSFLWSRYSFHFTYNI